MNIEKAALFSVVASALFVAAVPCRAADVMFRVGDSMELRIGGVPSEETQLITGTYTVDVTGDLAVSDPDTIDSDSINGRVVFLQVAQVR